MPSKLAAAVRTTSSGMVRLMISCPQSLPLNLKERHGMRRGWEDEIGKFESVVFAIDIERLPGTDNLV
jgi:hypothetical protein